MVCLYRRRLVYASVFPNWEQDDMNYLLVKCQNPHTEHLYADKFFTNLFSLRYAIDSFASIKELYMVFLHGESIGLILPMKKSMNIC